MAQLCLVRPFTRAQTVRHLLITLLSLALPSLAVAADSESAADGALALAIEAFTGDLRAPINDVGPYGHTGIPYANPAELPQPFRERLTKAKPGITRAELGKEFQRNGGLTMNEYYLSLGRLPNGRTLAVRVSWRPAAMPEAVYADPALRERWITINKPEEHPSDIAMRISKPFYSGVYID